MKFLISVCILVLIILVGCSSVDVSENTPRSTTSILNTQYRLRGTFDFGGSKATVIKTYPELKNLLLNYPTNREKIDDLLAMYNVDFFKHNVLYVAFVEMSSGSIKVEADKAIIENGILDLVVKTKTPEIGTTDMAYWICLYAVDKEKIDEITQVNIEIY